MGKQKISKRFAALAMSLTMVMSMAMMFCATAITSFAATNTDAVGDLKMISQSTPVTTGSTSGNLTLTMTSDSDTTATTADKCAGAGFTAYPLLTFTMQNGEIASYDLANTAFWTSIGVDDVNELMAGIDGGTITNATLVASLRGYTGLTGGSTEATVAAGTNTAELSNLPYGFYYVKQTTAATGGMINSAPILVTLPASQTSGTTVTWNSDVSAYAKTSVPSITKQIYDKTDSKATLADPSAQTTGWKGETDQSTGTVANFKVVIDVPQYTLTGLTDEQIATIIAKMSDTMSSNLSFNASSVSVYGLKGTETPVALATSLYTVNTGAAADEGKTFTVNFTGHYADIKGYDQLAIYYTANVDKAATAGTAELNNATYTYSNNPDDTSKTVTPPPVITKLYTYALDIVKVKGTTEIKLPGAEFTLKDAGGAKVWFLKNASNVYDVVGFGDTAPTLTTGTATDTLVTDANGDIKVDGLDAGTYTLNETKAPQGYTKITDDITVVIKAEMDATTKLRTGNVDSTSTSQIGTGTATNDLTAGNTSMDMKVANTSGLHLPATGGIGTIIFCAAGLIVVIGGVTLITVRRSREKYSDK